MEIQKSTLDSLFDFNDEREWGKFHNPENLAKSIVLESAELLELFQWSDDYCLDELKSELADILSYCFLLARRVELDPNEIIREKLLVNESRYPLSKSKGVSTKYNKL